MNLKPCPFCGQVPQITEMEDRGITYKMIYCENYNCLVDTSTAKFYETDKEAADAWNTRPAETALLDRVRKKIEAYTILFTAEIRTNEVHNNAIDDALRAVDEVEKEVRGWAM